MTVSKDESLRQLVSKAAIHSQQHRLTDYSLRRLSQSAIQDIGFKLVLLYEEQFEENIGGGGDGPPPAGGASTDEKGGESGRVVSREQPYR